MAARTCTCMTFATMGSTLAAPFASTKEMMARLGHSTPRAALIDQHATAERDQAIAKALDSIAADLSLETLITVVG